MLDLFQILKAILWGFPNLHNVGHRFTIYKLRHMLRNIFISRLYRTLNMKKTGFFKKHFLSLLILPYDFCPWIHLIYCIFIYIYSHISASLKFWQIFMKIFNVFLNSICKRYTFQQRNIFVCFWSYNLILFLSFLS